jgi:hypothetical protein
MSWMMSSVELRQRQNDLDKLHVTFVKIIIEASVRI